MKMWKSREEHFSDDWLIAHADGELPRRQHTRVRRHLLACWHCRTRLNELEAEIATVTAAVDADGFPGPERVAEARQEFIAWRRQERFEDETRRRRPVWVAAAAAALIVACGLAWRFLPRPDAPAGDPHAVMARARQAEAIHSPAAIAQVFELVSAETFPSRRVVRKRLEILSDAAGRRAAVRLESPAGELLRAVWYPAPEREYGYRAGGTVQLVRTTSAAGADAAAGLFSGDPGLEELEWRCIQFLWRRNWRPVSLSETLASLDGSDLRSDSAAGAGGEARPRLHVSRTVGAVRLEMTLELDRATFRPAALIVRRIARGRVQEVRLTPGPVRSVLPAGFEPGTQYLSGPVRPPVGAQPLPEPRILPSPGAAVDDPLLDELEVAYALHGVRACLGEPLEAVRAGREIAVRGVVAGAERREEILAALAPLLGRRHIRVAVQTTQEAIGETAARTTNQLGAVEPERAVTFSASVLRHFEARPEPLIAAQQLHDDAVAAAGKLLAEAHALRQIAERFGDPAAYSPRARWLLDAMLLDHLRGLQTGAGRLRRLLEPVLAAAGEEPGASAAVVDYTAIAGPLYTQQLETALRSPDGPAAARAAGAVLAGLRAVERSAETEAAQGGRFHTGAERTSR